MELYQNSMGLVAAIITLVVAVLNLISTMKPGLITKTIRWPISDAKSQSSTTQWAKIAVTAVLFSISVVGFYLYFTPPPPDPRPINEILTSEAWLLFEDEKYTESIMKADKCIALFQGKAKTRQRELTDSETPIRTKVTNLTEYEKRLIFDEGILNDVATCLYIKGRSFEALEQREDAVKAYRETAAYPHALTWDKKGWFWSPAEDAESRLELFTME